MSRPERAAPDPRPIIPTRKQPPRSCLHLTSPSPPHHPRGKRRPARVYITNPSPAPPGNSRPTALPHIPAPKSTPAKTRPRSLPHQPRPETAAPRLIPGIPAPSSPAPSAPRPYLLPNNAAPGSSPCHPASMIHFPPRTSPHIPIRSSRPPCTVPSSSSGFPACPIRHPFAHLRPIPFHFSQLAPTARARIKWLCIGIMLLVRSPAPRFDTPRRRCSPLSTRRLFCATAAAAAASAFFPPPSPTPVPHSSLRPSPALPILTFRCHVHLPPPSPASSAQSSTSLQMTRAACDLPHLKKFGVHAIWAYSVDSMLNHNSCMVALSGGGIYSMCVVALFHSFYSADNNHMDILDLTLALNGSIDTTWPIWGTNLPNQDDEEEAAADPACGEAAREELKGAGGAGRRTAVPLAFVPLRFSSFPSFLFTLLPITLTYHDRASDPGRRPCPARTPLPARSAPSSVRVKSMLTPTPRVHAPSRAPGLCPRFRAPEPAAYGAGGDGEGEYAYVRPPALRARGAEQGVRARQGAAAAPSRSSAHLAGCGADADAVPAARMRGGGSAWTGRRASQQRRGVMEVEGGLEGLTSPRDDASRRIETVLELLATADTTEKSKKTDYADLPSIGAYSLWNPSLLRD
ncbi:hypothetical protein B0H14DRAFT_3448602 [Mycena olivaceomarginata]|nr:hypothetical protein B0H14DRAFT_3448602 [Mycena olivaceomarginata]